MKVLLALSLFVAFCFADKCMNKQCSECVASVDCLFIVSVDFETKCFGKNAPRPFPVRTIVRKVGLCHKFEGKLIIICAF